MKKNFKTNGTCSDAIDVEVQEGIVTDVHFSGGCEGNLLGVSKLVAGMSVSETIERLKGIKCGRKNTSCPDQLARALEDMV